MKAFRVAAVTAEYNPFHNGHAFQILKTRQAGATHIVAVMSGNYVQRGEAALFEKHIRAEAVLLCGADLVLELPLPYAMATAERFAFGALSLMQALGCVDMVSFGSENSLAALLPVAQALADDALFPAIQENQRFGLTYAVARAKALAQTLGPHTAALVERPNNILAIEYLKAAIRLGFTPDFLAVTRRGAAHDAPAPISSESFASASALRFIVSDSGSDWLGGIAPFVPPAALEVYREAAAAGLLPASPAAMEQAAMVLLRMADRAAFSSLPDLSEGLENRLYTSIRQSVTLPELHARMKTKRYTLARIRRLALSACLGITEHDAVAPPPYLRILGMNRRGTEILSAAKHTAALPLSTSLAKLALLNPNCRRFAELEARSTDLYTLMLPKPLPCGYDYTRSAAPTSRPDSARG